MADNEADSYKAYNEKFDGETFDDEEFIVEAFDDMAFDYEADDKAFDHARFVVDLSLNWQLIFIVQQG